MTRVGRWLFAALVLLTAVQVGADDDDRSLHWTRLAVRAHLDADGRLHVSERHVMVFSGDWNGGYRRFNVGLGQSLDFERLTRLDPEQGTETELVAGDLSQVDHYDWEGWMLRWRSRLPSDPPFEHRTLTYVLDYTLSGILTVHDDGTFKLNHDFAFPERPGVIEKFEAVFDLDPAWQPPDELPSSLVSEELTQGESVIVSATLRYRGAGTPAGVRFPVVSWLRATVVTILVAVAAVLFFRFYRREAALGRFARLPAPQAIDEAWLRENLLPFLPEEAGAAWDDHVGSAEVAAILARLVAEGKLETKVREKKVLFLTLRVLHLRLTAPREAFMHRDYEQQLIAALFAGENETDTDRIRERYRQIGFDPAAYIRADLRSCVARVAGMRDTAPPPSASLGLALLLAASVMILGAVVNDPVTIPTAVLFCIVGVVSHAVGVRRASAWRGWLTHLGGGAVLFLVPALVPFVLFAALNSSSHDLDALPLRPNLLVLLGLAVLALWVLERVLAMAATRNGPRTLRLRQQLAAAREYFRAELRKPQPQLRDAWFPYVVAFGLGRAAQRWFQRFGGAARGMWRTASSSGSSSTSIATSGVSSDGSWTGGGGRFGGAGAGGAWVAAVGAIAAGVSAPSRSSSGSSSSGGSSSGGGGGGGW